MTHRGAVGSDARDGDGAGVMTSIPHKFFVKHFARDAGVELPPMGQYATGNLFFKPDSETLKESISTFEELARELHLRVLGWRDVPHDSTLLGPAALSREPIIMQPFVVLQSAYGDGVRPENTDPEQFDERTFERQLYFLRKRATHVLGLANWFYLCSLSNRNIVYKGQLAPVQVYEYYHDLVSVDYEGHFALVHSRFSTNTFPSWDRAQPLRWAAHNGEINTLRGNKNWMRAREGVLRSDIFGDELDYLYPIVEDAGSDSAAFDNVLELLTINGVLSLPEAVMLMVPEAWQDNPAMDPAKAAFYEWAACQMEPWDGPALFTFSDGRYCGANLDRNGLRPCRYYITDDDRIICASEVGAIPFDPERIIEKGRLQPGKMLLVDTVAGRIIDDTELKSTVASRHDFRSWIERELLRLPEIQQSLIEKNVDLSYTLDDFTVQGDVRLKAFGYSYEQVSLILGPMAADSKEALGSMGNDAPLACLAQQPRLLYEYFRQLFAQVTNPPIDPIREAIVMSLECYVGPQGNLLEMDSSQCHRLLLTSPILSLNEFNAIKNMASIHADWPVKTIDITFEKVKGVQGYLDALDDICNAATEGIENGDKVLILSDRATSANRVPVSTLLATGLVHHHLVRNKWRSLAALIVETAEAREVHHMCVLLGYGADGICPYLAIECILKMNRENLIRKKLSDEKVIENYKASVDGGILKVMSKMGISTLQSYKGAQIFEALGIDDSVIDRCFAGTASRIRGMTFEQIAQDAFAFHERGFPSRIISEIPGLPESGEYHWRDGGEHHINDPVSIANIQDAVRTKNDRSYEAYARSEHEQIKNCTLRGLLDFDFEQRPPVPIDQVEPWTEIVRRFVTGAMSYGSISMESHSALAIAMNRLGGKSNTGEGGEDAERSRVMENGDTMRSAIKQIASGRFGVTSNYLADADELQIKMAQGAKPGEGGELPGHKVSAEIGKTRHSTPGVGLISPPPHHDIYSIEDLKQLIYDLKCSNPRSRVSVKLVSEVGVGIVASGVAKAKADHILISGHDGGTGASRWTGIKYAGLPWELGLAETHQTLVLNDLRGRVIVQTDGQLRTGRDVAMACLLGAEEWGFATTPLIAMGCVMMRKCLGSSTLVRTASGDRRVDQIEVGDFLFDEAGRPVLCLGVDSPKEGPLKSIRYQDFDSREHVSFTCTPDHLLNLALTGVDSNPPKDNILTWFTSCNRPQPAQERDELELDLPDDIFCSDLIDSQDTPTDSKHINYQRKGHADSSLEQHYHRGYSDQYSPALQAFLSRTANKELRKAPDEFKSQLRSPTYSNLETRLSISPPNHKRTLQEITIPLEDVLEYPPHRPRTSRTPLGIVEPNLVPGPGLAKTDPSQEGESTIPGTLKVEDEPGLDIDSLKDIGERLFVDIDYPSSEPGAPGYASRSSTKASLHTTCSTSNGSDIPSSQFTTGTDDWTKFTSIRSSLAKYGCNCGGIRKISRRFRTTEQAQLAYRILTSDHYYLLDPYAVRNGDIILKTVTEVERFCSKEVKKNHLKLYRAPLAHEPFAGANRKYLPVEPYFLGLWLGDGIKGQAAITSSDREVEVWLQTYVTRLNQTRPQGCKPLCLSRKLSNPAGTVLLNGYTCKQDVYVYAIMSPQDVPGPYWNPVRDGLKELGVLDDKSSGIPKAYMKADEDARLAVLAGLMESDGCYVKSHNTYRFVQMTEEHRKIVHDTKELALSCGISVTEVNEEKVVPHKAFATTSDMIWVIYLGKGSAKFQHHLLLPRKRMNLDKKYNNHDARPFQIEDAEGGKYRAIEVSGGQFQLANRLVVHNCHLKWVFLIVSLF